MSVCNEIKAQIVRAGFPGSFTLPIQDVQYPSVERADL